MLCDVASIFAIRTFVVSQAFTMVLINTDRQFLNIHIHVQYITQTFDVLNLPAFYM